MLYFFVIMIDFFFVMFLDFNTDYIFFVVTYIIAIIILFHSLKVKDLKIAFFKAKGIVLYDAYIVLALIYIYYAIPAIFKSLTNLQGYSEGKASFIYLFPLIEWPLEILYDFILFYSKGSEFYFYQVYLLILGLKLGVILSINPEFFEFWYLIIFTII